MRILLLLLLSALPLQARIGEKYKDFATRVGNLRATSIPYKGSIRYTHKRDDLSVTAYVIDGIIQKEIYDDVSLAEAKEILGRIPNDKFKSPLWDNAGKFFYWESKAGANAHYSVSARTLSVENSGWLRFLARQSKQDRLKRL